MEATNTCWLSLGSKSTRGDCDEFTCKQSGCESCPSFRKLQKLLKNARIPEAFWFLPTPLYQSSDISVARLFKTIASDCLKFIQSKQNIVIWSETSGCGKSYMACRLLINYIRDVWQQPDSDVCARYVDIPQCVSMYDLFNKFSFESEDRSKFFQFIGSLNDAKLVVWDGVGYNSNTSAEDAVINSIIDSRISQGKSNIFILKDSLQTYSAAAGAKRSQRLIRSSIVVQISGPDYRSISAESYQRNLTV